MQTTKRATRLLAPRGAETHAVHNRPLAMLLTQLLGCEARIACVGKVCIFKVIPVASALRGGFISPGAPHNGRNVLPRQRGRGRLIKSPQRTPIVEARSDCQGDYRVAIP